VQEAVNNIVKHSLASQASVTLVREDGGLQISIRDNGRGFAPNYKTGVGLTSLAERVQMLGGTHQLESAPAHGTRITIQLPLTDNRQLTTDNRQPL
jgi:signal transduction histidine kinase